MDEGGEGKEKGTIGVRMPLPCSSDNWSHLRFKVTVIQREKHSRSGGSEESQRI